MKKTKTIEITYHICDNCEKELPSNGKTVYEKHEFCNVKCAKKLLGQDLFN